MRSGETQNYPILCDIMRYDYVSRIICPPLDLVSTKGETNPLGGQLGGSRWEASLPGVVRTRGMGG